MDKRRHGDGFLIQILDIIPQLSKMDKIIVSGIPNHLNACAHCNFILSFIHSISVRKFATIIDCARCCHGNGCGVVHESVLSAFLLLRYATRRVALSQWCAFFSVFL